MPVARRQRILCAEKLMCSSFTLEDLLDGTIFFHRVVSALLCQCMHHCRVIKGSAAIPEERIEIPLYDRSRDGFGYFVDNSALQEGWRSIAIERVNGSNLWRVKPGQVYKEKLFKEAGRWGIIERSSNSLAYQAPKYSWPDQRIMITGKGYLGKTQAWHGLQGQRFHNAGSRDNRWEDSGSRREKKYPSILDHITTTSQRLKL